MCMHMVIVYMNCRKGTMLIAFPNRLHLMGSSKQTYSVQCDAYQW
jgi:hypothetical protein